MKLYPKKIPLYTLCQMKKNVDTQPSFQLLADHLKKYTPDFVSEISSIPASTIRRIAKEFGEAAKENSQKFHWSKIIESYKRIL